MERIRKIIRPRVSLMLIWGSQGFHEALIQLIIHEAQSAGSQLKHIPIDSKPDLNLSLVAKRQKDFYRKLVQSNPCHFP